MRLSTHEIAYLALKAGFKENFEAPIMVAVVLATTGGETDYLELVQLEDFQDQLHGLAAIDSRHHSDQLMGFGNWHDPLVNMQIAYKIFQDSGRSFTNWEAYTTGKYKQYLPIASFGVESPVEPLPYSASQNQANGLLLKSLDDKFTTNNVVVVDIQNAVNDIKSAVTTIGRLISQIRDKFS